MRKTFNDPEFDGTHKKLVGAESEPLTGEMQETALKELPRDADIVDVMKKIVGAGPLPARNLDDRGLKRVSLRSRRVCTIF